MLRGRPAAAADPFLEPVGVSAAQDDGPLPFAAESVELTDREADELAGSPAVEDLVPSIPLALVEPLAAPERGPETGSTWGLEAIGAHRSPFTGAGVTVAVLDTGIDLRSPAFAGRQIGPRDLMDFTEDERGVPGGTDTHGHGTHVAATLVGSPVDGVRIGVAGGVDRVLIGKVLGPAGGSTETLVNAIEWSLRQGADVISMSLGIDYPGMVARLAGSGLPAEVATSRALYAYRANLRLFDRLAAAIEAYAALGRGALVVAAAGNESRRDGTPHHTVGVAPPAAADGFLSVGAVGPAEAGETPFAVAPFSNTGCHVSAPGVGICSAALGSGLTRLSGTSMAVPHVAGVLALWIQQQFPDGTRTPHWTADVRRELERHVIPVPRRVRGDYGLGVVQAPR